MASLCLTRPNKSRLLVTNDACRSSGSWRKPTLLLPSWPVDNNNAPPPASYKRINSSWMQRTYCRHCTTHLPPEQAHTAVDCPVPPCYHCENEEHGAPACPIREDEAQRRTEIKAAVAQQEQHDAAAGLASTLQRYAKDRDQYSNNPEFRRWVDEGIEKHKNFEWCDRCKGNLCGAQPHTTAKCPHPPCYRCNAESHGAPDCPPRPGRHLCSHCKKLVHGHNCRTCPERPCSMCKSPEHAAPACERQDDRHKCRHCGQRGHLTCEEDVWVSSDDEGDLGGDDGFTQCGGEGEDGDEEPPRGGGKDTEEIDAIQQRIDELAEEGLPGQDDDGQPQAAINAATRARCFAAAKTRVRAAFCCCAVCGERTFDEPRSSSSVGMDVLEQCAEKWHEKLTVMEDTIPSALSDTLPTHLFCHQAPPLILTFGVVALSTQTNLPS
eukprot:m.463735 g.463735  ORF g.463735 m.463735 type:complete len:437 (+) comp20355_c0_seq2:220-1530(+)